MAGEVEAKWWLKKPSEEVSYALNLEGIVDLDIKGLKKIAKEISEAEPKHYILLDRYYVKDCSSEKHSGERLTGDVMLEGMQIIYGRGSLELSKIEGRDTNENYKGFMRLLKERETNKTNKSNIRMRENQTTGELLLTIKNDYGTKGENSEEYEICTKDKNGAEDFYGFLGYRAVPEETILKEQEVYPFKMNGYDYKIEFNTVSQPGVNGKFKFLEIEAMTDSLSEPQDIKPVFDLALRLGIPDGKNLETRKYPNLMTNIGGI